NKFLSIIFLLLLLPQSLLAPVIPGNGNTAVSVQSAALFPAGDNTNTMLGFGLFLNGFTLADSTTTCTFNDFFPVSGKIDMRGGILVLNQDLTITQSVNFVSTGTFNGFSNNVSHAILFPKQETTLIFPQLNIVASLRLITSSASMGQMVNSTDWSFDNNYVASAITSNGASAEIFIYQFNGTTLTQVNGTSINNSALAV